MWLEGPKTVKAGENLEASRRVKIKPGTTTQPFEVVYADAGEAHLGVTLYAANQGELLTIKTPDQPGSVEIEASAAFSLGDLLYGRADGKVSSSPNGQPCALALEASGTSGDVVEVLQFSLRVSPNLGTIAVPLGAITMEDGTTLTKQATTVAGLAQLADKEQVILIPVDCSAGESLAFSVPLPADIDNTADLIVKVLAGKAADNDALTLDCEVYPVGEGSTGNDDIQDTAAQTITQAVSEVVFTCGADGVPAPPAALSVVLSLGGTNDGDAVRIYGARIEYGRKTLTA